jgi:hypothetical protein
MHFSNLVKHALHLGIILGLLTSEDKLLSHPAAVIRFVGKTYFVTVSNDGAEQR